MSEVFAGAHSTGMTMTILDFEISYNAHLLPNPNTMSIGSLTELSSFPFLKKRSGLNSRGSG